MSVVTYDGVTIPFSYHTEFDQQATYDPSNTDWYLMSFKISVTGILNTDYATMVGADVAATDSPALMMAKIRKKLLTPRKTLSVTFNGQELIPANAKGNKGTVDAANGPHPQSCKITMLTNTTFLISYTIHADYWENRQGNGENEAGGTVLYNRWTETQEIDDCNFSIRTRNGSYVIRSDNAQGVFADRIRSSMAVLGIPTGFLRQSSQYTISEDGLKLSYVIVDKEQYKMPPTPSFKAEGEYYEVTSPGGVARTGTVRLRLYGDKDHSLQHEVLQRAVGICARKLRLASSAKKGNTLGVLKHTRLWVDMYKNIVEVVMTRMYNCPQTRIEGPAMNYEGLTFTPGSDDDPTPLPPFQDRGTAWLLLTAAAYNDPTLLTKLNQTTGQLEPGPFVPGEAGTLTVGPRGAVAASSPVTPKQKG